MKEYRAILLTLLLAILHVTSGMGQESKDSETYPKKEERLATAEDQILKLRDGGALLVRLKTKKKSVDALVDKGLLKQAEAVRSKVEQDNLELVHALEQQFKFCPVYYFYSYDSEHILNGNIDSVAFLNKELEVDREIQMTADFFLTAELTLLEQETYKKNNIPEGQDDNPNYRREAKYYGGANMRFHAFIIKDDRFTQLKQPFPYYSRTLNSFFLKRKLTDVIEVMDKKLTRFYTMTTTTE